jgi:hypothetical protein
MCVMSWEQKADISDSNLVSGLFTSIHVYTSCSKLTTMSKSYLRTEYQVLVDVQGHAAGTCG